MMIFVLVAAVLASQIDYGFYLIVLHPISQLGCPDYVVRRPALKRFVRKRAGLLQSLLSVERVNY